MAGRHPRNPMAAQELALSLKRLAKTRPGTPRDIELETYRVSQVKVLPETIRKAFSGQVDPGQCNVELLLAFTAYYSVGPSDLGGFAERRLASVMALMPTGPPESDPDEESDASGWFKRTQRRKPYLTFAPLELAACG